MISNIEKPPDFRPRRNPDPSGFQPRNPFEQLLTVVTSGLAVVGGLGLLVAILVTCVSVAFKVTRRALDALVANFLDSANWQGIKPILGEEELVQYAVGIALFSALPWAMLAKSHIRIDIFQPLFGRVMNRVLNFVADASLAFVAYMIMTRQWFLIFKKARGTQDALLDLVLTGDWPTVFSRIQQNHETQILSLKLWPFYVFAEFCIALFFIVAMYCSFRSFVSVFKPSHAAFNRYR